MRRRSVQFLGGSLLAVALSLLYSIYSKSNQSLLYNIYSKSNQILLYNIDPKAASKYNSKNGARPYDIFYLVEQWPGTFCKVNKCKDRIPRRFTIHGLWPQNTSEWPLENCCGGARHEEKCKWNQTSIEPLLHSLNKTWPNLLRQPNVKFWKREWKKHGACSLDYVSQRDYFQRAIDRYDTYDLINILQDAGIVPDDNRSYPIEEIKNAIKNRTQLNVVIKCNQTNNYLREIYLCVNHDATEFLSCNAKNESVDKVIFPRLLA